MRQIPYSHQSIDSRDIKEVVRTLRSGWITQGPRVPDFEDALCAYAGAKYAVAVSSGTAALHIAYLAAGINKGDAVITSPITFLASANCILYCQGKPVFADIEEDTGNIECAQIKDKLAKNTKAIIPVHFAGSPCDMEKIRELCVKNHLVLIEDAAHAFGAKYRGLKIGACKFSDMAVFSFHPVKSITTGEGGAVLTNSREFYNKLLKLRTHGVTKVKQDFANKDSGDWYYEMQDLGFNYRLTDIQASLGISQLKKMDTFIEKRRQIAGAYQKHFAGNSYFDIPQEREYSSSAWHLYPIRLKDKFKNKRKEVFSRMRSMGLGVQVHYIPVYLQPYYKKLGFKAGLCPREEDFYSRQISLPIYPDLRPAQIKYVIAAVLKAFKELKI